MSRDVVVCRPASKVLGKEINCGDSCPFPFCVVAELSDARDIVNEYTAMFMKELGNTAQEIASAIGVSLRTAQRYTGQREYYTCPECRMVHSHDVVCRSLTYSVTHSGESYIILLNRHGHATEIESSTIGLFIDYVFPDSMIEKGTNGHDCWTLSRVSSEEAGNFKRMCDALNSYSLSLSNSTISLQRQQDVETISRRSARRC